VLNDIHLNISLFNFDIFCPLYPAPEENGFYGQDDKSRFCTSKFNFIFS
ncbi:hypothetical protein LCGC14_2246260, partial [marine sediment metagenome]